MTDIESRLERAVRKISTQPGTAVAEPATPAMLDRAEERLGRALPEHLRALLSLTNGLSIAHGLWRILGLERSDAPDLVEFNRFDVWKYAWDLPELDGLLVFSMTHLFTFEAYRPDGTLMEGFLPLGEVDVARRDLVHMIERGWTGKAEPPLHPDDAEIHRAVGAVPPGQAIFHGPSYFLTGERSMPELRLGPLEEILRMSGGLNSHADTLPPDTIVVAPLKEIDGEGRERWRWITDRDLPGLREAAGPDGVVSHLTVDGRIPAVDDGGPD